MLGEKSQNYKDTCMLPLYESMLPVYEITRIGKSFEAENKLVVAKEEGNEE